MEFLDMLDVADEFAHPATPWVSAKLFVTTGGDMSHVLVRCSRCNSDLELPAEDPHKVVATSELFRQNHLTCETADKRS